MRKIIKFIAFIGIIVVITAIDSSFLAAFGGVIAQINLSLIIGIFLVVIFNNRIALLIFLLSGGLAGLTATTFSIIPLVIGTLVLLVIDYLVEQFFTNRSYYTLIVLGAFGWIFYYSLFAIMSKIFNLLEPNRIVLEISLNWIINTIEAGLISLTLLTIGYILTTFMSKQFRSYFILHH